MKLEESRLQKACVKWFRYQHPELQLLLFSVPNGGSRNAIEASRLKSEGVVPGVSDLILLVPNNEHHSLCIEMKTEKGRQSELQKQWQSESEKVGNRYVVCRSFEDFVTEVENYLSNIDTN